MESVQSGAECVLAVSTDSSVVLIAHSVTVNCEMPLVIVMLKNLDSGFVVV